MRFKFFGLFPSLIRLRKRSPKGFFLSGIRPPPVSWLPPFVFAELVSEEVGLPLFTPPRWLYAVPSLFATEEMATANFPREGGGCRQFVCVQCRRSSGGVLLQPGPCFISSGQVIETRDHRSARTIFLARGRVSLLRSTK